MIRRILMLAGGLAVLTSGLSGLALASSYYHECATPEGGYRFSEDTLYETSDGNERQIPAQIISKTVIREEEGYCLSTTGRRYGYNSEEYLIRVRFGKAGQRKTLVFYCELAADGIPANETCGKSHKTKTRVLVPAYNTNTTALPEAEAE